MVGSWLRSLGETQSWTIMSCYTFEGSIPTRTPKRFARFEPHNGFPISAWEFWPRFLPASNGKTRLRVKTKLLPVWVVEAFESGSEASLEIISLALNQTSLPWLPEVPSLIFVFTFSRNNPGGNSLLFAELFLGWSKRYPQETRLCFLRPKEEEAYLLQVW